VTAPAVRELLAALVPPGAVVGDEHGRVRAFDTSAWLYYRPQRAEWQRRRASACSPVPALGVLDFLLELPAHLPVPVRALPPRDRAMLRTLPPGMVDLVDGAVVRRIGVPLVPLLAVIVATDLAGGLERASRFAAYCPRAVLAERHDPDALLEAAYYGIGAYVPGGEAPHTLLQPQPVTDAQPTAAWWRFCEHAYRDLTAVSRSRDAAEHHRPSPRPPLPEGL